MKRLRILKYVRLRIVKSIKLIVLCYIHFIEQLKCLNLIKQTAILLINFTQIFNACKLFIILAVILFS